MRARDFETLLDRFGADLSRWSDASLRQSAERLLASSAEARAMLSRAQRVAELIDCATPPPPPLAAIIEQATALPQMPVRLRDRPMTGVLPAWLGFGRWHAVAFASCLVLGILIGIRSVVPSETSYAVYDVVDGSSVGDFHE